jgi:hypothetical protein
MQLPSPLSRLAAALLFATLAVPFVPAQRAWAAPDDDDDYYAEPPSRVGRVSQLEGEAALLQPGSDDWQTVDRNTPVFQGDEIYVGDGSRVEVQLGGGRYVRLDERTDAIFALLDEKEVRVEVAIGSVIVSLAHDERFEISAPAAAVSLEDQGVYRIDVDGAGDTAVAVLRGQARASGVEHAVDVDEGEMARFDFNNPDDVAVEDHYGFSDAFASWSGTLDSSYDQMYASADSDVGSLLYRNDIYGIAELASYGSWITVGSYGRCWRPSVGYGWQPYSNGYWRWIPGYGYSWISYDPWGWAPFHYGRWAYSDPYGWYWVPWSQFSYGYAWSPGYVYWGSYPGYGGYVWAPLAPNEPYVETRNFRNRRNRDWVPEHLRAGRGIGVTQPGSGARLIPDKGKRKGDFDGRLVSGLQPEKPKTITPVRPGIKLPSSEVRERPVVVKNPRVAVPDGRVPVTDKPAVRKPVRRAVDATPETTKPARTAPRVDATPRVVPRENAERPRVEAPRERPTPRSVDREPAQPRVDRQPKADRPAPRVEQRQAPQRIESRPSAPARVAPAQPKSGGGGKKGN